MINVNACVIHEVLKEARVENKPNETTLDLSESLLDPNDEFVQKLLESIHTSFGDSSALKNTHFEKGQSTKFSTALEEYIKSNIDTDFFDFSISSIKALKALIEKENFATGGYYVFSDYVYDNRRFLSVMVVRKNKDALNLKKINKVHQPGPTENINTEKIAMGFRLNYNIYQSPDEDKNYIALLANQQDRELSGYFKNWVNAAGIISNDKNSAAFIDIVKSIDIPKDKNGNDIYTREQFKRLAHDFAEKSPNKIINLNTFSAYVYGEEKGNYVMNYASAQNITLDPEFKRSSTVFKKLITIHARVPGIELNIDYDKLNANEVDVQGNRIIIKSAKLVEQINAQK